MKAVGYTATGSIERDVSLIEFEMETPIATGRDLLLKIAAVSVNPVDTKIRMLRAPEGEEPAVLGWDAVGEVVSIGERACVLL
ncbi:MAG: hypothetical protein AAFV69_14440 [Pseudomonadota bacterium]